MMKRLTALLTGMVLLLAGCTQSPESTAGSTEPAPASPLTVTFLKVGKADAILLRTANHTVVLDCGEKSDGKKITARLEEDGVTAVDCLILSHYDQDHIGGAAKVISNLDVSRVIGADYEEESEEFQSLREALDAKGLTLERPAAVFSFTLDDALFTVYPHEADSYAEGFDNNCSLVVRVEHHEETLLFTGDAMQERLNEIMDIGGCDLLKVPYHGREIANLPEFLAAVKPEYAVISTNAESISDTATAALDRIGAQTYITCRDGNIIAVSDGSSITITAEGEA